MGKKEKEFNLKKEIKEWGYAFIVALVIALLMRFFLFTPTMVKQTSMYPTLKSNERLFLSRIIRHTHVIPNRGDIVTFEAPFALAKSVEEPKAYYNTINGILNKFAYNFLEIGKMSYIKRVIGLPGERIEIKEGKTYINGNILDESYLQEGVETNSLDGIFTDVIIPEDCVYVMGDNRPGSKDSRYFGCIPIDKIEGRVKFRMWPLNVFGKI